MKHYLTFAAAFSIVGLNLALLQPVAAIETNPLLVPSQLPYRRFLLIRSKIQIGSLQFWRRCGSTLIERRRSPKIWNRRRSTIQYWLLSNQEHCSANSTKRSTWSLARTTTTCSKKTEKAVSEKFSEHQSKLLRNPKLFARIQAVYDQRKKLGLDDDQVHLVER